jgi:hypothetical protein
MWGARGPFPLAADMVVVVVTPVVFCNKATTSSLKSLSRARGSVTLNMVLKHDDELNSE